MYPHIHNAWKIKSVYVIRHKKFKSGQKEICTIHDTLFTSFKEWCHGKSLDLLQTEPLMEREDRSEPDSHCAMSRSEECWQRLRGKRLSLVCNSFFSCVHDLYCFSVLFIRFSHLINRACVLSPWNSSYCGSLLPAGTKAQL